MTWKLERWVNQYSVKGPRPCFQQIKRPGHVNSNETASKEITYRLFPIHPPKIHDDQNHETCTHVTVSISRFHQRQPPDQQQTNQQNFPSTQHTKLMAPSNLYPRATLKRITKAHSNRPLSKNVDILVCNSRICRPSVGKRNELLIIQMCLQIFLDYVLFMQE
jgi:hypothetical protein